MGPEERIRDLVWQQNEEVHRALQEAHEENEILRQENALLREDLANAEKMLDAMRFRTPEGSRGEHGVGQETRADEGESFHRLPEGEAETREEPEPRPSERSETGKPRCETKGTSKSESGKGTGTAMKAEGNEKTVEFMMLMLQSMQEMQRNYMKDKSSSEVEVVRNGVAEFPMLGEWDAVEGPLAWATGSLSLNPWCRT